MELTKLKLIVFASITIFIFLLIFTILLSIGLIQFEVKTCEKGTSNDFYNQDYFEQDPSSFEVGVEYLCKGSCYCVEHKRRSSSAITLTGRGLIFLAAALSSSYVYEKAKIYFNEKCEEEFLDSCSSESIVGEIDECIPTTSVDNFEDMFQPSTKEPSTVKFVCKGNCLRKKYKKNCEFCDKSVTQRAKDMTLAFGCESLILEEKIVLEVPSEVSIQGEDRVDDYEQSARYKFQEDNMREFCFQESKEYDVVEYTENGKMYFLKKPLHLCMGANKMELINHSIQCKRI